MEGLNGVEISVSILSKATFDIAFFYRVLMELPESAGLTPLGPPVIYSFPTTQVPGENGFTGTNVMIQSHVAFHHWPANGFIHLTISSCKPVDEAALYRWICRKFKGNRKTVKMASLKWRN